MNAQQGKYYGLIVLKLGLFLAAFLTAVHWMVLSFQTLNSSLIEQIVIATSNPFISLFIGLLLTAIIQSSSTITITVVAIVASGTISLENAVFMIMGANIGTTVTSTLVALGHVTHKKEFRKAISAATIHDFFNICTALILVPLEYFFKLLSRLASSMAQGMHYYAPKNVFSVFDPFVAPLAPFYENFSFWMFQYGILSTLASILILFLLIQLISGFFKKLILDKKPNLLEKILFRNPYRSFLFGTLLTGLIQSSSLISSLIVPIVANNKLSLKRAFPFLMGANVGTTLTALLAAFPESEAALSVALAHFLFNFIGVLIFLPIKPIRRIPLKLARRIGRATIQNRLMGFIYVVITFFVIPFLLIYFSNGSLRIKEFRYYDLSHPKQHKVGMMKPKVPRTYYRKLIYKSVDIPDSIEQISYSPEIFVQIIRDSLYINQMAYYLREPGTCWNSVDRNGPYEICLEEVISPMELNRSFQFDSCYVYFKTYPHSEVNYGHRLFIARDIRLVVCHELLDSTRQIIGREELIGLVE